MERQPNTQYILSLSYGKDSLACLEACKLLGYPIDRVIHAEVWATDTIPADLPPMVEFKSKADEIIKERYGLVVDHVCATRERERESATRNSSTPCGITRQRTSTISTASPVCEDNGVPPNLKQMCSTVPEKLTYEKIFYQKRTPKHGGKYLTYGFPMRIGQWCNSVLKVNPLTQSARTFRIAPPRKGLT